MQNKHKKWPKEGTGTGKKTNKKNLWNRNQGTHKNKHKTHKKKKKKEKKEKKKKKKKKNQYHPNQVEVDPSSPVPH